MKPIDSPSPRLRIAAASFAAVMLSLGVTACFGSDDSSDDSWRIGLEAPLSGDLKTLGKGMLNGAQLAAEGTAVVWSARSNVSLYGQTLPATGGEVLTALAAVLLVGGLGARRLLHRGA